MHYLSTALSTVAAIVAVFFAFMSSRHAERALRAAQKLEGARGRLVSLESAVDSLDRSHRKLSGRFYAERQERLAEVDAEDDKQGLDLTNNVMAMGCDNWRIAAIEGPKSEAASCECGYCVSMREARRQMKAARVEQVRATLAKRT